MRDERGRYHSLKDITESVPAWACGCDQCKGGIVSAPDLMGVASLYLERMAQAIEKSLIFCSCAAGQAYRASLLNRRQQLIEEARRNPLMQESARRLSHPDIENTLAAMNKIRSNYVPTVRFEKEMAA